MTFDDLEPGDWVEVGDLTGQVVWKSFFSILQFGAVMTLKEFCLFTPKNGKYKIIQIESSNKDFSDIVSFSKDRIGGYGL